ncbi:MULTISPECIES: PrgH/EprH family type III secretion apparatus protein [Kluyvera]|uniref:PrgH/EprH family type III secretion apparatus protein n=1 Tax=Kluyvera genomosp. 3 TaxID=2774055 RepID=A0A6G9RMK2_9ENTR|nr:MULTISPECIES: PrgH/EprH family type III secretion apparatus protein [Kluyvera]QIR27169.1 PrgH/EprH family type III secretion apparatus protein [Kluyvera genomosp. 3]UAK19340.1 PrgH/EprH family type III secretion apparatus protein [Kluyvera sp. CRP]
MLEKKQNNNSARKVVIRLINGSLRGCEFTLTAGRTVFIVCHADDIKQQHQGTLTPDNTIYIPCSVPSPNFEIFVPEDKDKLLVLHVFDVDGATEQEISANKLIAIGEQKICWRDEKDAFSDDLLTDYVHQQSHDDAEQNDDVRTTTGKSPWWKLAAAFVIIGCVSAAGYSYLNETQRQITSVAEFLDNKVGDYHIIYGKDSIIYILSESESAAQWAIQSMIRTPSPYRTKILTTDNEAQRIGTWIESNWPQVKLHRVRLDYPEHPVIEVSAERTKLSPAEMKRFTDSIAKNINYATDISVKSISDQSIRRLAIDGLEKLSLSFTEVKNSNSVTLVIRGALDDGELERLKTFITHYSQIWKGEYVQFAMELKDDWLKGKSYKYGDRGYVKLSPGHWYFPRNIKKEL